MWANKTLARIFLAAITIPIWVGLATAALLFVPGLVWVAMAALVTLIFWMGVSALIGPEESDQ